MARAFHTANPGLKARATLKLKTTPGRDRSESALVENSATGREDCHTRQAGAPASPRILAQGPAIGKENHVKTWRGCQFQFR